jgi:TRAP transporter 4TM/12TM fusion protein
MSENKDKTFSMADMVDDSERVDADALMAQFDIESNTRHYRGLPRKLVRYMLAAFTLFALYMSIFPTWSEYIRRGAFVSLIVFMAFMMYPASRKNNVKVNYVPWYDFVLAIVGAGCFFYIVANNASILVRASRLLPYEVAIGIVGILILAEVCRRCVGVPILVVVGAFVAYAFFAGYSINRVIYQLFYTLDGVMGTPIGVCTTFIALFIILAAFLEKTNIGSFFIDIANSVAGWASGGPAKVAVITSAFEGMYSGSSVANTVGSGSITIPVMKKTGYAPEFAAAVEAAASTGGQIMPPIMGAAAFLMAEMTELPYSTIVVAAILPAILYFTGIFIMIHYEAKKLGLKGISRDQIPNFFKLFFTKGYLLLPIVVLVLCMNRMSASMSASWAILTAIVVSMFRKDTRMTPTTFVDALENGAKNTIGVAAACAIAGIIVGIVALSGIGLKLADGLLTLSGGIDIVALGAGGAHVCLLLRHRGGHHPAGRPGGLCRRRDLGGKPHQDGRDRNTACHCGVHHPVYICAQPLNALNQFAYSGRRADHHHLAHRHVRHILRPRGLYEKAFALVAAAAGRRRGTRADRSGAYYRHLRHRRYCVYRVYSICRQG